MIASGTIGMPLHFGRMPAWLMSHPKVEDRVAAIEVLDEKWTPKGDQ